MKRVKVTCPDCGIEISRRNIKKHTDSKTCLHNQKNGIQEKGICPHCGLDTTDLNGSQKANHVRWCNKNPKRTEYTNKLVKARKAAREKGAWNKGLTKETDERVKKQGSTLKERYASGELTPSFLGKKHTEESKLLLKKKALENDYERVNKNTQPYTTVDGKTVMLDSNWERIVAKNLDEAGIKWIRPKPLKWYDKEGWLHNYFSDFYIPEWDVYLDPKNSWVIKDQAEKWEYLNSNYDNIFILGENQLDLQSIKDLIKV